MASAPSDRDLVDAAVALAREVLARAGELQTREERRQQAELDRMIRHPADKVTLVRMTDQAFRSRRARRAVDQLAHVLDVQGIPRFFSPLERTLLLGFQTFGSYLPEVAAPLVEGRLQSETATVVLPAEPEALSRHLRARRAEGLRMNLNFLGEALLGEDEARRRLDGYLEALASPDVEIVSVKISTLFSQIDPIAREATLATLCDRLERLYRAAAAARFRRADGSEVPKFVYLDMEEYRDTSITTDAFLRALDRPGLAGVSAGMALQAYLPDAFAVQQRVTGWARRRVDAGGAPVTLRIVKGANLEGERVEASIRGWPQAPFRTKRETDANYKRMLRYGLEPSAARAVRVGVASHNLFDLCYALVLSEARGVRDRVQLEMLEGMANHVRRALRERAVDLVLYAPACRREDFVHAIGYLIRRLDENTGPENFLRHAFRLRADSDEWHALERAFRASFEAIAALPDAPRRTQDRRRAPAPAVSAGVPWQRFANEPDTDFSLPHHADWAASIRAAWGGRCGARATDVPLVIDGREIRDRPVEAWSDPSRPGVVVSRRRLATARDVDDAVACARADADGWRGKSASERAGVLRDAAQAIRERRADLMGVALAEAGKVLSESDPEVSEAVDFCELYGRSAEALAELANVEAAGLGVVAVVPPWNFPIAIPCGGVAAALAAGNTAILKPAPAAVATAYLLCECFWAAGVSKRSLQLVFGPDGGSATHLATHAGVDAVVFTGGTQTALHLLALAPSLRLLAETGGKNATIVTALADRDLAIKHVVHSAFSHAGQKCSATSLLILEDEVYEDEGFRRALCDAARSLPVGSAWEPATKVGPLIRPPSGKLSRALTRLEPGEVWALEPRPHAENPNLWTPGIKWGVTPGGFTHSTELFGPVLGVMRARGLEEAIDLVHETGYGLTAGLESLDDREQATWSEAIRAGNLYLNRGTTGAVVLRQPFGGMGKSAIGPGLKAGGPHYVVPLMRFRELGPPQGPLDVDDLLLADLLGALEGRPGVEASDRDRLRAAAASYARERRGEFGAAHDSFRLLGQDNLRRYRPLERLRVRVDASDAWLEVFARVCAARLAGSRVVVSSRPGARDPRIELLHALTEPWAGAIELLEETDDELAEALRAGRVERVRYAAADRVPASVRRAAAAVGAYVADAPVLTEGRIELLWYVREQSLSADYHRYGNLGDRADEARTPPL